jgi:hypothetical protein
MIGEHEDLSLKSSHGETGMIGPCKIVELNFGADLNKVNVDIRELPNSPKRDANSF